MANVGLSSPYASWIFEIQILKTFFDQPWARNKLYQYCITISMQCLGFGIAGLARSCIVFPDYCVFPKTLPTIILNRSLHERSDDCGFRIRGIKFPQFRYLWVLGTAYFVWHLFNPRRNLILSFRIGPGFLCAGSLENFNWITWIKPDSKVLALITGGKNGLGLNPLPTFDFNHMAYDVLAISKQHN
jgi:hypothetical protein